MRKFLVNLLRSSLARRNRALVPAMVNLGRSRYLNVFQSEYTNEYIRLSQLDLAIHEIVELSVPGDMAELGVYKGTFAAVLNKALPDRFLYLFDTFEGFDPAQEREDEEKHGLRQKRNFADTSVDLVLSRMAHPDKCIIRKGFFPQTAEGLEDHNFCFVSLDADLYTPILDGLEFFYDRLFPGGFIFVHDYNNSAFPGAKGAVREFAKKRGVTFVPVTDAYGTSIFRR